MTVEVPVRIRLTGIPELDAQIGEISKKMVAGFAFIELGTKLFEFTKKGIEDFQAEALASAKLTNALGFQSKALEELAKTLSKGTLYKEKDIKAAEGSLALYVKSEAQIKKLTPAVLDMAEALGMDLESAAKLIGRSFESNVKTIGRTGISIDGAAGSAKRLESIMKGLNERFGGSAKAMSDSQGEMAQFGKNIEEIGKAIGGELIPVLNYWSAAFIKIKDSWVDLLGLAAKDKISDTLQKQVKYQSDSVKVLTALKSGTKEAYDVINSELAKYNDQIANSQKLYPAQILEAKSNRDHFLQLAELIKSSGNNATEAEEKVKKFIGMINKSEEEKPNKEKKAVTIVDMSSHKEKIENLQKELEERLKLIHDWDDKELFEVQDHTAVRIAQDKEMHEELVKEDERFYRLLNEANRIMDEGVNKKQLQKTTEGRNKLLQDEQRKHMKIMLEVYGKGSTEVTALEAMQSKERVEFAKKEMEQKIGFGLQYASTTIGLIDQIATATKANAQVMKRIKEGEAIISAARGALGVIENSGEFIGNFGPIAGPIAMGAEIALMVALASAQISQIESAKMAYGGIVRGGTPGIDSVPAMLMPGELVYNPAHPNPAVASMISNSTSNSTNHLHVHGPQITIQGNADQKTISKISQATHEATVKGVSQALRTLQARGKVSGITLYN